MGLNLLQRMALKLLNIPLHQGGVTSARAVPKHQNNRPTYGKWTVQRAVREGYEVAPVVFACVDALATAAASVPLRVERRNRKGNWQPAPDEPLQKLLDKPNPFMSRSALLRYLVSHLTLAGNGLWTKIRVGKTITELWPILPDLIAPVPDSELFINSYEFRAGNDKLRLPVTDVMHFMQVNPANLHWGIGNLQVLAKTIEIDTEAMDYQKVSLENRGAVSGILTFANELTSEDYEAVKNVVKSNLAGAGNARRILTLDREASYQQMSFSPQELDFLGSRVQSRTDVCIGMRVPPPMASIYEDATLANIETARLIFWQDRMIPLLTDIAEAINLGLTPEFGNPDELTVLFDFSGVQALQENYHEKVKSAATLVRIGFSASAVNQRLELGFNDADIVPVVEPIQEQQQKAIEPTQTKKIDLSYLTKAQKSWSDKVTDIFVDVFKELEGYVLERFKVNKNAGIDTFTKNIGEAMLAIYRSGVKHFAEQEFSRHVKSRFEAGLPQDIDEYLASVASYRAQAIVDTTKQAIQAVIEAEVDDETKELALRELFNKWQSNRSEVTSRARLIGETEAQMMLNYGQNVGAMVAERDYGLTFTKTWMSQDDAFVRKTHQTMHGETIRLGRYYSNGLRFPSDPEADTAETVGCRCYEIIDVVR